MGRLGSVLKFERTNKNKSMNEVAEYLKKSNAYVSMVENNKTKPTSDYLYDFAKFLFIDYSDEEFYYYLVAEKYIHFCLVGKIEVKFYPKVKLILLERGMIENNKITNEPYFSLNWLLDQHHIPITFGFMNEDMYNFNLEKINPINSFQFFNGIPKYFVMLEENDKSFLKDVISSYLKFKYTNQIEEKLNGRMNDVDLIQEALHYSEGEEEEKSIQPLLSMEDIANKSDNIISIRKNWTVINETDYQIFFSENELNLTTTYRMNDTKLDIIGSISYEETKNSLTNFKINIPYNFIVDINEEKKQIKITENNK